MADMTAENHFDEDEALAEMLQAGVLFSNNGFDTEGKERTVCLFVNCNDLFAWACADAECVQHHEIESLYRAWKSSSFGIDKWCCKHRKQKPQKPVEDAIRQEGHWDDEMEALPANTMDAETQAMFGQVAAAIRKNPDE